MFPMVAENHARDESSSHLLMQALFLATLMCSCGAIFYFFFGEWVIRLFYGESYRGAGEILRYYGFAILPMTLVMVAEYFLIAKGRVVFAYLFMAIAPLQFLAVYWYHDTLLSVVGIMAATGVLLSGLGFGLLWRPFKQTFLNT
jgi:O-antigen/teichoic acid export membrane protein